MLEGTDLVATIALNRNLDIYSGRLVIEYATSDLTAQGVDRYKFDSCLALSPMNRAAAGCGDYEQTRGLLILAPNSNSGGFKIRIMNDMCKEFYMKYVQVTMDLLLSWYF